LLCLDIMMPHLDGYEVCRRVRASDAQVPVLFLSAKSEEIDVVVGLQLGADDFIRKPFGKHELRCEESNRPSTRANPHCSGTQLCPFTTSSSTHASCEPSAPASPSIIPARSVILQLLHEHGGEVVARDTILNQCWGLNFFPESRTLDQHIAKLRKRIEVKPDATGDIETCAAPGYRYRQR
jgi:DNA-binding response OmpR family regulator